MKKLKSKRRSSPFLKENMPFSEIMLKISIAVFFAAVFIIFFINFGGINIFETVNYSNKFSNYEFQLHTIDVENGDAFLLRLPGDKTMLIDCGEEEYSDRVVSYLNQYMRAEHLDKIDYFVLTHTDSDHVGSASKIIEKFEVKNLYRPKKYSKDESKYIETNLNYQLDEGVAYNNAIMSAYKNNCNIIFNERGLKISLKGCEIEFLSPVADTYENDNNYSAVLMIRYYGHKFLFMGDAEGEIENALLDKYGDELKADVLKIAHHGSKTSSTEAFLCAVDADYAILSCSENSSILPNAEVIKRIKNQGSEIFSSAKYGNFVLSIKNNQIVFAEAEEQVNFWVIIFCIGVVMLLLIWRIPFERNNQSLKSQKSKN